MSVFTLLTVLFLLVLGATIAWIGDVIGYRLGKSRRSLFGMRPRRTARFIGMLLGALLPIAGLFVAALGSEHVRLALFHIEDLKREQADLQVKLSAATDAAAQAEKRSGQLTKDIAAREQDARESRARLSEVRARLAAAQENLRTVTARSAALRTQVVDLQRTRDSLRQTLAHLKVQNEDLQKQYRKASDDLLSTEKRLVSARTENNQLRASAEDLRSRVDQLQRSVASSQSTLVKAREEIADAERNLASAKFRAREAEAQVEEAQQRVREEQRKYERFKYRAEHPFTDEGVLLEQGQELVRFIIDGRQTQDQIVTILFEELSFASKAASAHGVAIPEKGSGRAVQVVAPVPLGVKPDERVSEAEIVSAVARQLRTGGTASYVVRVLAVRRFFTDDDPPADVAFVYAPNKIAFTKGQTVVEADVDGSTPRDAIFGSLWNIMPSIRQAARSAGMLPDPETGQYGGAPAKQLLDALDRIQQLGGPARVRAVAVRETYIAEPLVVDIQVTPGEQEGSSG